jgi:hypothetical protein
LVFELTKLSPANLASFPVTVIIYLLLICYNLVNLLMKLLIIRIKKEADLLDQPRANERTQVKNDGVLSYN